MSKTYTQRTQGDGHQCSADYSAAIETGRTGRGAGVEIHYRTVCRRCGGAVHYSRMPMAEGRMAVRT